MKSKELISLIQRHDPRGEAEVRIETVGLVGGVGSAYARCPTIEAVWCGIDWDSGNLMLRPSLKLRRHKEIEQDSPKELLGFPVSLQEWMPSHYAALGNGENLVITDLRTGKIKRFTKEDMERVVSKFFAEEKENAE